MIHHQENLVMQPAHQEETNTLRRSTCQRRQLDRYQDYNLDEVEFGDTLIREGDSVIYMTIIINRY